MSYRFRKHRKKPETLDLTSAKDRVLVLRAYHNLLSEGMSEEDAKLNATAYVFEHWDELVN